MDNTNDTAVEASELLPLLSDRVHGAAVDLEAFRDLADQAGSAINFIDDLNLPGLPGSVPLFIDRKAGAIKSVRNLIEEYRQTPARKRGTAQVNTLESFIDLTDRHKTVDSVIFADTDWRKPTLTAVIDYHENASGGGADNGSHRVHYAFPLSEEWQAWVKQDGKPMDQQDFAQWIEDHLPELAAPGTDEEEDFRTKFSLKVAYPNEMVALSRGLQVHVESRVKNNVVLQTGEGEITWDETHTDGKGNKIQVPGLFIISLPCFFMGEPVRVPVRLRYRAAGGSVTWFFKLYRPDVYITQQVVRDLQTAAAATELPAYQGSPEMSA